MTVDEGDWLAKRFEAHRNHLRAVAYRMLGSHSEAEDAVQEAWLHLSRSDTNNVENLGGWLTTVVARVCLDMLRTRRSRREAPISGPLSDEIPGPVERIDPEQEALLADSVGPALLVVLDSLAPAERLAFVLHDMFAMPFDEIAPIVGRSAAAARQLASRARRRVQGATPAGAVDPVRQRQIVDAFLAASRNGDFDGLLMLLDPDVVLQADSTAVKMGATAQIRGATKVAETFAGRAQAAEPALVDGAAAAVWASGGGPRVIFNFVIRNGKIVEIGLLADRDHLSELDVVLLHD